MSNVTATTPREIDEQLADLHNRVYKLIATIDSRGETLKHAAGARYYYRGRQRVTDMTLAQAIEAHAELAASDASHYTRIGSGYDLGQIRRSLAIIEASWLDLAETERQIKALNEQYTGWSRFFLVTSSAGHVHSSMCCSTCNPRTTYGWQPSLSGKSEAEAVALLGPALCSVCFPSAPVDHVGGKITVAAAERLAH